MIIWINGAFGAGKTTIAERLQKEIQGSYIYDPENLGDFFWRNLPQEMRNGDFQDYLEWRQWNVHLLKKMAAEYAGTIIVPMSLYREQYFHEIIDTLKEADISFYHIQLEVSRELIIQRLSERNEDLQKWGEDHVDEILAFFEGIPAEEKILNQNREPEDVVQEILRRVRP